MYCVNRIQNSNLKISLFGEEFIPFSSYLYTKRFREREIQTLSEIYKTREIKQKNKIKCYILGLYNNCSFLHIHSKYLGFGIT